MYTHRLLSPILFSLLAKKDNSLTMPIFPRYNLNWTPLFAQLRKHFIYKSESIQGKKSYPNKKRIDCTTMNIFFCFRNRFHKWMWSSNSDNSDLHSAALIFDATTTQFDIDKSDEYAKLQFWCLMKGSYVHAGPEHVLLATFWNGNSNIKNARL